MAKRQSSLKVPVGQCAALFIDVYDGLHMKYVRRKWKRGTKVKKYDYLSERADKVAKNILLKVARNMAAKGVQVFIRKPHLAGWSIGMLPPSVRVNSGNREINEIRELMRACAGTVSYVFIGGNMLESCVRRWTAAIVRRLGKLKKSVTLIFLPSCLVSEQLGREEQAAVQVAKKINRNIRVAKKVKIVGSNVRVSLVS